MLIKLFLEGKLENSTSLETTWEFLEISHVNQKS